MLKKILFLSMLLLTFILFGCTAEKNITIKNSAADELFITTITALKKELPTALISFDFPTTTVSYYNYQGTLYPSNVEMKFLQNGPDADVLITAENADENKLTNLQTVISKNYEIYLKSKEIEATSPQLRRIDLAR